MCGRVVQARGPLQVAILCGLDVPDTRFANVPPRYNAAPSQELWAIRQNNDTGQRSEPYRVFRRLLILEGWSHDQAYTPVFS
jgi:putative SOS response-associated peptidase YedK